MAQELATLLQSSPTRLSYTVHSASGHHTAFPPEKVLQEAPTDDTSRWTAPTPEERKKERKLLLANNNLASGTTPNRSRVAIGKRESEWILLELEQTSIVKVVGFGKTTKEFSIFGGLSSDPLTMEPLVEGSLKNDSNTERVELPTEISSGDRESTVLPIKFLRIECHEAASPNYSISIWHLFLEGHLLTPPLDSIALKAFEQHREMSTAHLVLAHLRRSGPHTLPAFDAYLANVPVPVSTTFEHPAISKLHQTLVLEGDFDRAEPVLDECLRADLFREWSASSATDPTRRKGTTIAKWERLDTAFPLSTPQPGPRGGHQMVRIGRKLLLFGGWDGKQDLGDLWEWELSRSRDASEQSGEGGWRCLSTGNERDGTRPGKRSCHQLAVDESEGWVYLLGARRDEEVPEDWEERVGPEEQVRVESDDMQVEREGAAVPSAETERASSARRDRGDRWQSDFWRYKAVGPGKGKWELLSADTRKDGGPALLFDHAMVVHPATQRLFVFGGKWQPYEGGDAAEAKSGPATSAPTSQYSGLYCYDIGSNKWTHVFGDPASGTTPAAFLSERLLPRAGHSMALDASGRNPTIYVYGGQRDTRYENDLWAIRLASPRTTGEAGGDDMEDEGLDGENRDDRLWRQGAVLDAPRRAVARSLIDASLLPVSPESSPSRASSVPTIVQIQRISASKSTPSVSPPAAFTPRLSLTASRTLTLLTGLTRTGSGALMAEQPLEGIWRSGEVGSATWERIEEWSTGSGGYQDRRPRNRFASQVVYDPLLNEHYVFGGHPHDRDAPDTRLSDFWRLRIIDPTPTEALRMAKFLIRKQRFNEMCTNVPTLFALQYLQNDLSSVVDHSSPVESAAFRSCMTALLSAPPLHNIDVPLDGSGELPDLTGAEPTDKHELYSRRHQLFEELLEFFPRSDRQPTEALDDISRLLRTVKK